VSRLNPDRCGAGLQPCEADVRGAKALRRIGSVVVAAALVAAAHASSPVLVSQSRLLMGTLCEVHVYHDDPVLARAAADAALDAMERTDALLSNYKPESELSAMNREAARAPFHASADLFDFVSQCDGYHRATGGAFDPTVGPLVRAWGFMTSHPARPSDAAIADAKARSGFDKVTLDAAARTIAYRAAGVEIDPGGIGKGYAVDQAVAVLKRLGIRSALVSAGGSTVFAIGAPPGRTAWNIAVKNPADPATPFAVVSLRDTSLSTSGVSERAVQAGTHRYSHLFDPRSGDPVEHMCQATVVAPTGTASDALTKAAFVLPRETVQRLFEGERGVHALRAEGDCGVDTAVWATPWSSGVFGDWRPVSED
jgi:FAD:protein FMN transferase